MSIVQLQAGSVPDSIRTAVVEQGVASGESFQLLAESLSYFDVDLPDNARGVPVASFYKVAENLVSRGLPTRPSLLVEGWVNEQMGKAGIEVVRDANAKKTGSIRFSITQDEPFCELLWRALHVVDPNLVVERPARHVGYFGPTYGSAEERLFFEQGIETCMPSFVKQLIESERSIESVLLHSPQCAETTTEDAARFKGQRIDYSLEILYGRNGRHGFVFEVDGSQHGEARNVQLDERRDASLANAGYRTMRVPARAADEPAQYLGPVMEACREAGSYLSILYENTSRPLVQEENGIVAMNGALVSFACSRVAKAMLRMINEGSLDTSALSWRIVFVERDIPCGELALNDLTETVNALAVLCGERGIPDIELTVVSRRELASMLSEPSSPCLDGKFDLLIDHAILSRSFENPDLPFVDADCRCTIRSAKSVSTKRRFCVDEDIAYHPLGRLAVVDDEEVFQEYQDRVAVLEKLLRDVFRKEGFRPGQVRILDRSLQCKSAIGLLPTGSGKSLTYQLAALLQPGVCVVVDPLKSLMRDQHRGLLANGLDGAVYINSSLNVVERENAVRRMIEGEVLFSFISPERFQSESFRSELGKGSSRGGVSFSYCVIDEAHCVSEWGHEFRTSYLRVGESARRFCKSWGRESVPMVALTATASYDVLADIQRELDIEGEDSLVTLSADEMKRKELTYRVVEVGRGGAVDSSRMGERDAKRAVGEWKQGALEDLLRSIDVANEPTLVFCPHKNGPFGVNNLDGAVTPNVDDGTWLSGRFMGSSGETMKEQRENELSNEQTQDGFVSGDISLLYATKAFGMGIDKPDIRNVCHINFPSSIEGYYQEAGRAGRDRERSTCTILYCPQRFGCFRENSLDAELLLSFHRNSFRGQDFEKYQLYELLSEIRFPRRSMLAERVESELTGRYEVASCNIWTKEELGLVRLYVNDGFGFFDMSSEELPYRKGEKSLDEDSVEAVRDIIRNAQRSGDAMPGVHVEPGIEKELSVREPGERFYVRVPFENDTATRIREMLVGVNAELDCEERLILKAASFCVGGEEFINKLGKELGRRLGIRGPYSLLPPQAVDFILGNKLFYKIRNQESTMKAVYRLLCIGVIEDYTIDYNAGEVTCLVERKGDNEYQACLREYLKKYFASERVDKELVSLDSRPGRSMIQKCLNLLIEFTYSEIAAQRRSSIEAMEEACRYGLDGPDDNSFEDYIMMYMSSRYARRQYLPADTENGNRESFDVVEKYIDLVRTDKGGEINNLKHLRGAATLLHAQRPENYVFLLLRAFSTFVLDKGKERFVDQAIGEAMDGFDRLMLVEEMAASDMLVLVDRFAEKVALFDEEAAEAVEDVKLALYHQTQLNWLKTYAKEKPYGA